LNSAKQAFHAFRFNDLVEAINHSPARVRIGIWRAIDEWQQRVLISVLVADCDRVVRLRLKASFDQIKGRAQARRDHA
jgi:hypothetical protein